jgi:hypothetical protein
MDMIFVIAGVLLVLGIVSTVLSEEENRTHSV